MRESVDVRARATRLLLVMRVPGVVVVAILLWRVPVPTATAAHVRHAVRRRRGLVQRLVRALEVHEAGGRLVQAAVAQAAERDRGEQDDARGDGHADDERQVRLDTDRSFVLYPVGEHTILLRLAQSLIAS